MYGYLAHPASDAQLCETDSGFRFVGEPPSDFGPVRPPARIEVMWILRRVGPHVPNRSARPQPQAS